MTASGPGDKRLVYSTDKAEIVKRARGAGMSDAEILRHLLRGEYGQRQRVAVVREWAKPMGLSEQGAVELARMCGLVK